MFPDLKNIRGGLVHANPSFLTKIDEIVRTINAHEAAFRTAISSEDAREEKLEEVQSRDQSFAKKVQDSSEKFKKGNKDKNQQIGRD
jgi:hypothetical protein